MFTDNGKETPYINSRRSMYYVYHKQREIYTEIHNSEKVRTPKTKKRFEKKSEREKVSLFLFVFKSNNLSVDFQISWEAKGQWNILNMGENICQHEILLSTDKVKYIQIEGVSPYLTFISQNYPAYASDGSE